NIVLGILLSFVLLFPCGKFPQAHNWFAISFFAGNALAILIFSPKKELWFKGILVVIMAASIACYFLVPSFTLFWAEWVSLVIIGVHYILESFGVIR
ncbi:MAG: hypothetical protein OEY51_10640, partial [Cyclobacteriaceae bacterium]|nr:hypothetical protein [Cyclobacteriaceae bacterium]